MLMIDLRKAFDTLSWDFLHFILTGFGLPAYMVTWIMECVSSTSFSISLNAPSMVLLTAKGVLGRGSMLSPYLFILAMEYLSRMLKIRYAQCEMLSLSHLVFADDIMVFSRGDVTSVQLLMNTLRQFSLYYGLEINGTKSFLFAAGVSDSVLDSLQGITNFIIDEFPVKYLGLPLSPGKLKASLFAPLIERISGIISSWTINSLSYADKLELIIYIYISIEKPINSPLRPLGQFNKY